MQFYMWLQNQGKNVENKTFVCLTLPAIEAASAQIQI